MKDNLDDKLARLDGYLDEIQKDVKLRSMAVDRLLRDVGIKVDVLERQANLQRRVDAVKLREKAHGINDRILTLLDGDNPDVTSAAKLFIIKNILEAPIDLENPQILKSLASAARSLGADSPIPLNPGDEFQV